ncbi:MAG: DUF3276 family protein [Treponemataceae bacterium]|nr:DUF3276 family protein [Treponemataceae bacterium]
MGIRGELYTNQIVVDNRAYYFNVKENRKGDVFLQIVESKKDEVDERHAIVIFASELQKFCKGFDSALSFIDKDEKEKKKAAFEKKKTAASEAPKKSFRSKKFEDERENRDDGIKRSGKVHVVSKRTDK